MNALLVLLRDFTVIALGALLAHRLTEASWPQVDWPSDHMRYPALLFSAASNRPNELGALLVMQSSLLGLATLPLWTALAVRLAGTG